MNNFKVTKATLTKGRTLKVDMTETLEDGSQRKHPGVECDQPAHDDCVFAFAKLRFHLARLCELKEADYVVKFEDFIPLEDLQPFSVQTISISGSDESEGVCLSGMKKLRTEMCLNLNTPFTKFTDEDYKFASELYIDVEAAFYEVEEYMFNGKYAIKQLEIPFGEANDEVTDENAEDKPKKKRGRKQKLEPASDIAEVDFEDSPIDHSVIAS
jgi:hypothetical protein